MKSQESDSHHVQYTYNMFIKIWITHCFQKEENQSFQINFNKYYHTYYGLMYKYLMIINNNNNSIGLQLNIMKIGKSLKYLFHQPF